MVRVWAIQTQGVTALFYAIADARKTFSAGYTRTTNNRMELMAAIVALEALKEHCEVILSTDSQYVRRVSPSGSITGKNVAGKPQTKNQ